MDDDLIVVSRRALDNAILRTLIDAGPNPTTREALATALEQSNKVMALVDEAVKGFVRSEQARKAAYARHAQAAQQAAPVAPQPLQNGPQAAISPAPLPTEPPPAPARRGRGRPPANPAPAPLAIPDSGLEPAPHGAPANPPMIPAGPPFAEMFAPAAMPVAPVVPPVVPPVVVEHPATPPHPFGG
jgi:hypothetical protein